MGTIFAIGVFFVGAIIWVVVSSSISGKEADKNSAAFNKVLTEKGIPSDQILYTDNNRYCLSVNENKRKLSFGVKGLEAETTEYDFSDIVTFEVQVDDKTSNKMSVGGAVVGAALAGGVGAIIGSQSGNTKTKVRSMNLLITVNSISDPLIKFSLMTESPDGKGWNSDGMIVQNAIKDAEKWTGIFNIILKSNN